MAVSAHEKASPYEVRCPRCDVSFPVGTRTCLHCGGPNGKPGQVPTTESFGLSETDHGTNPVSGATLSDSMAQRAWDQEPIKPVSESPFSIGSSIGGSTGGLAGVSIGDAIRNAVAETGRGRDPQNDRELETSDPPNSVARSLFRSLGGLLWVILLIGFSFARSCGD